LRYGVAAVYAKRGGTCHATCERVQRRANYCSI